MKFMSEFHAEALEWKEESVKEMGEGRVAKK